MYNYRKLAELPKHLVEIKDLKSLKDEVLFNFDFLLAKLQALGYQSMFIDFVNVSKAYPDDKDIKTLLNVIKGCGRTLLVDPYQLSTQLHGRLAGKELSDDLNKLLRDSSSINIPCFIPNKGCFESPGESLIHSFVGHVGTIENASFTADGTKLLSVALDSTLK